MRLHGRWAGVPVFAENAAFKIDIVIVSRVVLFDDEMTVFIDEEAVQFLIAIGCGFEGFLQELVQDVGVEVDVSCMAGLNAVVELYGLEVGEAVGGR